MSLISKIRNLFKSADSQDVLPPEMPIVSNPASVKAAAPRERPPQHAGVRPLRGQVHTKSPHENVLEDELDKTEELLTLSEEDFKREEGFNPYDTGSFTTTGVWDEISRK